MILIDADNVISLWNKYHYSIATHAIEYDEELRKLPTVDAIPVSWIQVIMQIAETVGAEEYAEHLEVLLADWAEERKEE